MHTCDSKGSLALYDASDGEFGLIRLLPNALARLDEYTANTIAMDNGGRRLACIGPSEFVITVYDARSLDEVLRFFYNDLLLANRLGSSYNWNVLLQDKIRELFYLACLYGFCWVVLHLAANITLANFLNIDSCCALLWHVFIHAWELCC